jgi:hypothetical protein
MYVSHTRSSGVTGSSPSRLTPVQTLSLAAALVHSVPRRSIKLTPPSPPPLPPNRRRSLAQFKELFRDLDVASLARQYGVSESILSAVGIDEFLEILNDPPPGVDELIALAEVVRLAKGQVRLWGGSCRDIIRVSQRVPWGDHIARRSLLHRDGHPPFHPCMRRTLDTLVLHTMTSRPTPHKRMAQAHPIPPALTQTQAYDRVVIDTAPTGHTLRLLAFPDFLDSFLAKLIKLQLRVSKLLTSLSGIFGGGSSEAAERARKTEEAFAKVERAKEQIVELRRLFHDHASTEFCVVTIATHLAVAESTRLLTALKKEGIAVRHVVLNKLVLDEDQSGHMQRIARGQELSLKRLERGTLGGRPCPAHEL